MSPFKNTSFIGINLLTYEMNDKEASKITSEFETLYNLPTADLVRFGNAGLIKSVYNLI